MAALAIPPVGHQWIPFVPRPLYLSAHGYDWAPFLKSQRPGKSVSFHFRVFGLGLDLQWNQAVRFYMASLGARWLVNVAAGFKGATPAEYREAAGGLGPPSVWRSNRFFELTLLGFQFAWGQDEGEKWRLRFFWNQRRVFWKRANHADRRG